MKRYQYVVAAVCLCLSAMGFVGIYTTNQTKENDESAKNQQIVEESEQIILDSGLAQKDEVSTEKEDMTSEDVTIDKESVADVDEKKENDTDANDATVGAVTQETLHFNPENGLVWPIEGSVLLDYSTDATIFFPTLQQYQYNPAMVLSGKVNDKVYFVAKGKITNIETNEVTGCTVTQDLGDGYTAVYGQLKELNFQVGDMVESGQVVGYVSEPTKYYSVEGSNVYFQILKNGVPVDPEEILP